MNELFPVESVTMDSPRLAWMKRHGLVISLCLMVDRNPWTCRKEQKQEGVAFQVIGIGETEEEACMDYAMKEDIPSWNEETHHA